MGRWGIIFLMSTINSNPNQQDPFSRGSQPDFQNRPPSPYEGGYDPFGNGDFGEANGQDDWQTQSDWQEQPGWQPQYDWETGEAVPQSENYEYYDEEAIPPAKRGIPWYLTALLVIFFLIFMVIVGGFGGYYSGIDARKKAESTQISGGLQEQYNLALTDIQQKHYGLAEQRLAYILQHDPKFPGLTEKLAQVKIAMSTNQNIPMPTVAIVPGETPQPTATVDTRNVEELFNTAQAAWASKDWDNAINMLLKVRREVPDYNSVRMDGMLYIAYRNRGVRKILSDADLEGGTYDLALAEHYGPLDSEARSYRQWVNLYTQGASFWDMNWEEAVQYFSQVAQFAPQLRDASGWTSTQRYQLALGNYADKLAGEGKYCEAVEQYNILIQSGKADAQPTATYVQEQCSGGAAPTETPTG